MSFFYTLSLKVALTKAHSWNFISLICKYICLLW